LKTLNWTNFSPLSVTKKQDLPPNQRRPSHTLFLGLEDRLGTY
jgi:hypothetical protein